MKIFGSKASKRSKKDKKKKDVSVYTPYDGDPDYHLTDVQDAGVGGRPLLQGSSRPRDRTRLLRLLHWRAGSFAASATWEAPRKPSGPRKRDISYKEPKKILIPKGIQMFN